MDRLESTWRLLGGAGSAAADERLAAAAGDGDAAAFRSLAQRYSQPAFSYAYHVLGGYDDAQDVVQETLIQLFQSLPSARHDLPFRPWFYQILRRKCLDALRRRRPVLRLAWCAGEDGADESPADALVDTAALPEDLFERRDLQHLLREVIEQLPPRYREVVLLRYVADLTFDEMATALRVPVNTAKTRFQRAKLLLRPLLLARHAGIARPSATADDTGPARSGGEEEHVDPS